jgi:hypothetical protein
MNTVPRKTISLFIILFSMLLASCAPPSEAAIQGWWEWNSVHLQSIAGEQHLTTVWNFDGGSFYHSACCFNTDLEVSGRYRILDSGEDFITIELYDTQGTGFRFGGEMRIEIEDGTLTIQGAGPYESMTEGGSEE